MGGGIVIRNQEGDIFLAEACFLGRGTSLMAESIALLRGLELCKEHNLFGVEVEIDCKLLFQVLTTSLLGPWSIFSILVAIRDLLPTISCSFRHIFREANSVADFLSKHASFSRNSMAYSASSIPVPLRGLVRLDQQEILAQPNIREDMKAR